jgi:O-antigen/teichoic acid export membrane protein
LLVAMLSARYLGPEGYGQLSLALSIVALLSMTAMLGLDTLLVQRLIEAGDQEQRHHAIRAGFWLRTGSGAIAFALALLVAVTIGETTNWVLVLVSVPLLLNGFGVAEALLLARRRSIALSGARLLATLMQLAAVTFLVLVAVPLPWFAGHVLISGVILAAVFAWVLAREGAEPTQLADRKLCLELLRLGWPVLISYLLVSIHVQVDRVMISLILGDAATGIYTAAVKPVEGIFGLPMVVLSVLIPGVIESRRAGEAAYARRWQGLYDGLFMAALLMAMPLTLFAEQIVVLLNGPAYEGGGAVMAVTAWGGVFIFMGAASGRWLILEGLTGQYLARTCLGLALNIVGNFVLLPRLGIVGAAVSTVVAQAGVVLFADLLHVRTRPVLLQKLKAMLYPVRLLLGR